MMEHVAKKEKDIKGLVYYQYSNDDIDKASNYVLLIIFWLHELTYLCYSNSSMLMIIRPGNVSESKSSFH